MVAFDDDEKSVKLSLCQAEILKALAKDEELSKSGGCVPELQKSSQYVLSGMDDEIHSDRTLVSDRAFQHFIQSSDVSCLRLHQESLGASTRKIF